MSYLKGNILKLVCLFSVSVCEWMLLQRLMVPNKRSWINELGWYRFAVRRGVLKCGFRRVEWQTLSPTQGPHCLFRSAAHRTGEKIRGTEVSVHARAGRTGKRTQPLRDTGTHFLFSQNTPHTPQKYFKRSFRDRNIKRFALEVTCGFS